MENNSYLLPILTAVLTGGFAVSLVNLIRDVIMWKKNRKAAKEDKEDQKIEERLKAIEDTTAVLVKAEKYNLYDRIRFLGQEYIKAGEVDFDDRRILNDMHSVYHSKMPDGLGGNGDLDELMKSVNKLPLKMK